MEHWSQSLMKMAINYIGDWANIQCNRIVRANYIMEMEVYLLVLWPMIYTLRSVS